ncbi:MAG: hypothetical protein LZF86_70019 [Nitrospira sp.]|nr:MAG: hypothetical protein LZF86_70019 [Nitrospira sp.]
MTTEQKIIKTKVGRLELTKHPGNVSKACQVMGYSRDSVYRRRAKTMLFSLLGQGRTAGCVIAHCVVNDRKG